jgi:hypothetical protein
MEENVELESRKGNNASKPKNEKCVISTFHVEQALRSTDSGDDTVIWIVYQSRDADRGQGGPQSSWRSLCDPE